MIDSNKRLKLCLAALGAQKAKTTALYKKNGVKVPSDSQRVDARKKAKRKDARVPKASAKKKNATFQETIDAIAAREERAQELAEGRKALSDVQAAAKGLEGSERVVTDLNAKRKRIAEQGDTVVEGGGGLTCNVSCHCVCAGVCCADCEFTLVSTRPGD
jgi:hypothetical protein